MQSRGKELYDCILFYCKILNRYCLPITQLSPSRIFKSPISPFPSHLLLTHLLTSRLWVASRTKTIFRSLSIVIKQSIFCSLFSHLFCEDLFRVIIGSPTKFYSLLELSCQDRKKDSSSKVTSLECACRLLWTALTFWCCWNIFHAKHMIFWSH